MASGDDASRLFDPSRFDTTATEARTEPRRQLERHGPGPGQRVVRVLPDVSGLTKEFDYLCPAPWADQIEIGTMVRAELKGRRVAGWVTAVDVDPTTELMTLTRISSIGPPAEILDLARWAAYRWHGRLRSILKTASPPRMVKSKPRMRTTRQPPATPSPADPWPAAAINGLEPSSTACVEVNPNEDLRPLMLMVAAQGSTLILTPTMGQARSLAGWLSRQGVRVHLQPNQWAGGFSGGVVIGSRSAVWAPVADLKTIVVVDEDDEAFQEERVPTWHARDVAIERARRTKARCLLISATPTLAAERRSDVIVRASRSDQRRGWPLVEVIDRRADELGFTNLFSQRLVELLRPADSAVLILNRKGRSRLLACSSCGELARTEDGLHLMIEDQSGLLAPATGERRPVVCASCGGTKLKRLRLGISRATEELSRLLDRRVTELSSDVGSTAEPGDVVLGTEAALRAVDHGDVVAFLDFDQELLAPRYRAAEQALTLLRRAARLVGPRRPDARLVIQTRLPDHRVIRAASAGRPGLLTELEGELRSSLELPPFGALAEISGAGGEAFVELLRRVLDDPAHGNVRLLGPRRDGRYLLSVPEQVGASADDILADLLAAVPRPGKRVRVAVDPPRA